MTTGVSGREIETRVMAIRDIEDGVANIFGMGTYVGDEPCPLLGGHRNPKIVLDDGRGVVWGCQCWWGPVVDTATFREKAKERWRVHTINLVPAP